MNIKKIGIYCFINTHNGKRYVGQSIDIDARHKGHLRELNNNTHRNAHLQGAFNKYGSACFEFHMLEECGADMLDMREIAWINYYHSFGEGGYNLTSGGENRKEVSEETRAKQSAAKKGKTLSAEHKRKISVAGKGRTHSAESKTKIGGFHKGKIVSLEQREAQRKTMTGRKASDETRQKMSEAQFARQTREKSLTFQDN